MPQKTTVEPHALTRRDRPTLRWSVEEVGAKRGVARADIINRKIWAPAGLGDLERVIRAHELMHARITPAEELDDWVKRGVASWDSLQAVEEIRVNYAIQQAGFDLNHLTDGAEDADGEYAVISDNWKAAVTFAVATAGTAGGKKFLVGVRRQSKSWANALQKIQKHFWKQIEGANTGRIGRTRCKVEPIFSTEVHRGIGLAPAGFAWTERWAEYLDRLGAMPSPTKSDKPAKKKGEAKSSGGEEKADESDGDEGSAGEDEKESKSHEISNKGGGIEKTLRDLSPLNYSGSSDCTWGKLIWGDTILSRVSKGTLGKKRIAVNYGRSPRRIHRLYTDPQRRCFDQDRKGKGGIVLVDGSGSMSLSRENILQILKVAPGALVAIYSDIDSGGGQPNIHIIAKDGKCVEEKNMPIFGRGNGVDYPALEWAIAQRKRREPVIWVTDGGVCGTGTGGFMQAMAIQCIKTAKNNKVICVDHVDEAVKLITALNSGRTVNHKYPEYFQQVVRQLGGMQMIQTVGNK